jgi:hypothetical protein
MESGKKGDLNPPIKNRAERRDVLAFFGLPAKHFSRAAGCAWRCGKTRVVGAVVKTFSFVKIRRNSVRT